MTTLSRAKVKQEQDYARRMKGLEKQMEHTVKAQTKVAEKKEKTGVAAKSRQEKLNIKGKHARNQFKDQKHDNAMKQQKMKKKEMKEWLRQREEEESNKLKNLSSKHQAELETRHRNTEAKNDRFQQNTDQINRTKHYEEELKKIDAIKKQRRNAEAERKAERKKQEKREDKKLAEMDTRDRQDRLQLQREYQAEKKLGKHKADEKRIKQTRKVEEKMKADQKERERQMAQDLKEVREEFESKCREVRTYGLQQVRNQMKVINMFTRKGKEGGRTGKSKSAPLTNGPLLPSLPSPNAMTQG